MPPEPKDTTPSKDKAEDGQESDDNDASSELDDEIVDAADEIIQLNDRLDSLSTFLDNIEQQNDELRAQILLLLDSQRETLKSFKEENSRLATNGDQDQTTDGPEPMQES